MISLALALPTLAREDRARRASLDRTLSDLGLLSHIPFDVARAEGVEIDVHDGRLLRRLRLFQERQANWALGQSMFRWLEEQTTDYVGVVQDDVRLHPDGWRAIEAMLEVKPRAILGLHASHPALRQLFLEGGISWATTDDGLVGTMWIMPRAGEAPSIEDLVRFSSTELCCGALESLHEDDLIGVYAMARGIPIHHPVVSPMDHDVSVASAYGNDNHAYRRPAVTLWEAAEREAEKGPHARDWTTPETYRSEVAHLGRFYKNLFEHLPLVLADAALGTKLRAKHATRTCPPRLARYFEPM